MKKVVAFLVGFAALAGCGGNVAINRAHVRFINLVPNGPSLDFYVNDTRILHGFDFTDATSYRLLDAGTKRFGIAQVSQPDILAEVDAAVEEPTAYSVLAVGLDEPDNGLPGYQMRIFSEESQPPVTGTARFRIVHAAPSVHGLDWYVTQGAVDLDLATPNYTDVDFATATSYASYPVGTWRVRATLAGTKTVMLDKSVNFSGRQIYSLYVRDAKGGGLPIQPFLAKDGG